MSERVDCAVAERCGGCALIGLAPAERHAAKRASVSRALRAVGIDDDVLPLVCSPRPRAYRNRAKLAVARGDDGRVRLGLFRRGSDELVDLQDCPVQSPVTLTGVHVLREWAEQHALARPDGPLKYVDLRETVDSGLHVTLVLHAAEASALPLDDLRRRLPSLVGLSLNLNPRRSSYPFGERTRTPWGTRTFVAGIAGGEAFEVPATGFFQVGTELLPAVHRRMRAHFDGARGFLLDLYCGVGTHALSLAAGFDGVVGIEQATPAISCARRNADRHGVEATFLAARVGPRAIDRALETAGTPTVGAVVLNPGRAGSDAATLDALPDVPIAYLSCEPEPLARDLLRLRERGRPIVSIEPFDFMPQTDQVETLALLARASASSSAT